MICVGKRFYIILKAIMKAAFGFSIMASSSYASISIVTQDGVLPIEEIAKNKPSIKNQSNLSTPSSNVSALSLLRKYGNIENALFNLDKLTTEEQEILRELVFQEMIDTHQKIEARKRKVSLSQIESDIEHSNNIHAVTNDPKQIKERRIINANIEKAQNEDIFKPTLSIDTKQIDPESNDVVSVNTKINSPAAISFFDQLGNPYPIVEVLPKNNTVFDIDTINENILIIKANHNFKNVSGFIFLKGVSQPIPLFISSNPDFALNTKLNIQVPKISPDAKQSVESVLDHYTSVNSQDDPAMFRFLNGRNVPKSKRINIDGLPSNNQSWRYNNFIYIKTPLDMLYDMVDIKRIGNWKIYKAHPRSSYWFSINGRDTEVFVDE
ncbi:hypothetical protein VFMJ11_B0130 (plasmid) [Aliivibrio fischeri MJ11]|uniref:Uncharacterized protein n=2 Tax=Aliivibrio fischeri TaxID=668 RepID=B5EW73_ALIFM|nr:hypothetical protein VFMJ11_B0130 [Aliivibrio fischeri MJ11]